MFKSNITRYYRTAKKTDFGCPGLYVVGGENEYQLWGKRGFISKIATNTFRAVEFTEKKGDLVTDFSPNQLEIWKEKLQVPPQAGYQLRYAAKELYCSL